MCYNLGARVRPITKGIPMSSDDRFDRLDDLTRELKEVTGVHIVDIEANDGEDEIIAHADVGDVHVLAWREDNALTVYSDDEGFEDPDDVRDHIKATACDDDFLNAVLDEAEWLQEQHGRASLADYRDHLRGES